VANPVDQPQGGFGSDLNQGTILRRDLPSIAVPLGSKVQLAHQLYDALLRD
jgi:phosphopantothenoylcysteine decarboxylase/phosphopantothenate--cysteine ligase